MPNKTIPELDAYGAVDVAKKGKDLFETAKNNGTFSVPDYPLGASRKVTADELVIILGAEKATNKTQDVGANTASTILYPSSKAVADYVNSKGYLFTKTSKITAVISGSTPTTATGFYVPLQITEADKGTYFNLNISGASILHWGVNTGFNIQFTGAFPDGFSVGIHINSLGAAINNKNSFYLNVGKTHIITYSLDNDQWFFSEMLSVSEPRLTYLPNYYPNGERHILTNTNHTYVLDTDTAGDSLTTYKQHYLLPANLWIDREVRIYLANDIANSTCTFEVWNGPYPYATSPTDRFIDSGARTVIWNFPTGSKAGSYVVFRSIGSSKIIIADQNIII